MSNIRTRKLLNFFVAVALPAIFFVMAFKASLQAEPEVVHAAGPAPSASGTKGARFTAGTTSVTAGGTFSAGHGVALPSDYRKLELSRELTSMLARYKTEWSANEKSDVVDTLLEIESKYGFRPGLFLRLMEVESNFKIRAVSRDGARGLCQIQPETARQLSRKLGQPPIPEELLFDPVLNLRLSAAYLSYLEHKYKALPKAISAYNMGPGAFSRVYGEGGIPKGKYHDLLTR